LPEAASLKTLKAGKKFTRLAYENLGALCVQHIEIFLEQVLQPNSGFTQRWAIRSPDMSLDTTKPSAKVDGC
jgi:hypothetical protein